MSPPETPPNEYAPLWIALLGVLGGVLLAIEARQQRLALSALATLVLVPTVWRVFRRRWVRGDVVRGLGMGFIACHAPLLVGACSTLGRPECRIHLCLDGVLAGAPYVPGAGLLGILLYWAWAPPVPESRDPPFPPHEG